ncbi:4-demethylwyosine synthase TYW1 [Candidatus Pacearchaeota archaeon]|nr:4-demethylwyosine synthase TYW1 [Candidatus Pacearchaeota archaeon]
MIPEKVKKILQKQHYALVGKNSAVQICRWTKKSMRGKRGCWKEKFYGIKSHQCCQFSPAVMWCENKCLHCWRPIEMNLGTDLGEVDEPEEILEKIVEARKKLLIGFKGNTNVSKKKFEESLTPSIFTLSLSGEPTLYPKLSGLIRGIRKRRAISFLVTNGLNPEVIAKLDEDKSLPTQLTISVNAPNEQLWKIWHCSTKKEGWKKLNETLEVVRKLKGKTRRVFRLTLVKKGDEEEKFKDLSNMKEEHVAQYAKLIQKAEPDFVHVKGFKSLGYSRERLGYSKQPFHEEVKEFAEKLAEELKKDGYKILDEEKYSCVVVLGKNKSEMKIREEQI